MIALILAINFSLFNEKDIIVDRVVLNHVYKDDELIFSQYLIMKWHSLPHYQGYVVTDWFLESDSFVHGSKIILKKNGMIFRITPKIMIEYHGEDLEMKNRIILEEVDRLNYLSP